MWYARLILSRIRNDTYLARFIHTLGVDKPTIKFDFLKWQNVILAMVSIVHYECFAVSGGILNDKNFTVETEGNRICLQIAKEMVKLFGSPSVICKELADWLITTLQKVIETLKDRGESTKILLIRISYGVDQHLQKSWEY